MSVAGDVCTEEAPVAPKSTVFKVMFIQLIMKEIKTFAGPTADITLRFLNKSSHDTLKTFPRLRQRMANFEQHPNLLLWAKRSTNMKATLDLCHTAAEFGNVEMLLLLKEEMDRKFWDDEVYNWRLCASAAKGGNLAVMQWMLDAASGHPLEANTGVLACAAWGGHLGLIQWLQAQPQPCGYDKWACVQAAANGHIRVLEWLRAQDPPCPWDASCFAFAAANGQVDTLSWLRNEVCPWDADACLMAAKNGQVGALEWLLTQDPPCPWHLHDCMHLAQRNRHANVVAWILANTNQNGDLHRTESAEGDASEDESSEGEGESESDDSEGWRGDGGEWVDEFDYVSENEESGNGS